MALMSDAAMVLFCDVSSDAQDHDDWHSTEHMHERLSIPGFLRGTRWVRVEGSPRYMIVYEVANIEMANAPQYLERLNHPTPWTSSTMKRLQGMRRGFCRITASVGYGLGHVALALRFRSSGEEARRWIGEEVTRMVSWRGMASVHLLEPVAPPPMTNEQSLRGRDSEMTCVLLATAYEGDVLHFAVERHLKSEILARRGIDALDLGTYELGFTATAAEVARGPAANQGPRPMPE